ncbi:MAG: GAF domain-containing protein [Desulfobacterales bacterium]|nr:GAF domain-containing protein [Desulfobacterales bacterium]MBF0398802.1 GAF domain-containing protein [Desulfobacterales bacterium]
MKIQLKIRDKAILIIVLCFGIYIFMDFMVQNIFILNDFMKLEEIEAKKDMERCVEAINREIYHLDLLNHDWSAWDDTYQYTINHNQNYSTANLGKETFERNKLNFLYIIDNNGIPVFGKGYDTNWENSLATIDNFNNDNYRRLIGHQNPEDKCMGIFLSNYGYALISSRPIITSEGKGPIRGTILMARLLTPQIINKLKEQTKVDFQLTPKGNFIQPCKNEDSIMIQPLNNRVSIVSAWIYDIDSKPAMLLKAIINRDISARGKKALLFSIGSVIIVGVLVLVMIIVFLQKTIFNGLIQLAEKSSSIITTEDLSISFKSMRLDEIGALSNEFEKIRLWVRETLNIANEQQQVLIQLGQAISEEKDTLKLLDTILVSAMLITNADAGTIYLLNEDKDALLFEILKNKSKQIHIKGSHNHSNIEPEPVPLYINGQPNHSNVSAHSFLTGKVVNFNDVYQTDAFHFEGVKKYDRLFGYHSKSMLVVPLKDHDGNIIGALQLINAIDFYSKEIIAFSPKITNLVLTLAAQATIAITNTKLIKNLKELFHAFIKSIAKAIDEKSPYTGGHISRVVALTGLIVDKINKSEQGVFKDVFFIDDQIEEIKLSAWMHDIGKITTPDKVVDKATRLYGYIDGIDIIKYRFNIIALLLRNAYLNSLIGLYHRNEYNSDIDKELSTNLEKQLREIDEDFRIILHSNTTSYVNDETIKKIATIGEKKYTINGIQYSYLTPVEIENLSIKKGTLTTAERRTIEDHVRVTQVMLNQLPFPRELANIPVFAAGHHEKLDGSGYHQHLKGESIPLGTRILTVADIFEALTAKDRPYRSTPIKITEALKILGAMVKDGHIDADIYELLLESDIIDQYAQNYLMKEQCDGYKMPV